MTIQERINQTSNEYPEINWDSVSKHKPKSSVTFVIPVINSQRTIGLVLKAISTQHLRNLINEVIIVDNSDNDETKKAIDMFCETSDLKVIYRKNPENKHTAYSRNRGIELATGDVICFIDSDIIIPPNYVNYHLYVHELFENVITTSLRSNIELAEFSNRENKFPVQEYLNEFRVLATVKRERCITDSQLKFAGKTVNLVKDTREFRDLGNGNSMFWTLSDMCLTCCVTYKAKILKELKGAPENFVEYGCEDAAMAAKVISTGAFVIPITMCGVYHIDHPRRYGENFRIGYERNIRRLEKLYTLPLEETCTYYVDNLDIE